MHTDRVLLTHIAKIADEPLVLDPNDLGTEIQTNTWSLSAPADERTTLSVGQAVAAFEETAVKLGRRVLGLGATSVATFYIWHDIQAGQLRCSTSSQAKHALPFRSTYATTNSLEPIIAAFLNDPQPGMIEWDELTAADEANDTAGHFPATLNVWVHPIGQSAPDSTRG